MKNKIHNNVLLIAFLPCLIIGFCMFCSINKHTKSVSGKKPNLLIIICDQWRGQSLGFLNEDPVMTPHLDSFAKKSLVLKNFISNYPVCSPARAMLMTGQYPFTNHVYCNVNTRDAPFNVELSARATCWSDILKSEGYSLGYIGKWHLTSPRPPFIPTYNNEGKNKWNGWTPPDQRHGFDYWYSYGTYDHHLHPMYWSTKAEKMDYKFINEWEPQHDVDKGIDFLENKNGDYRAKNSPFGLVVSMNPPHSVYTDIPEKYYDLYKNIPIDSLVKDPDIPAATTPMGNYYRKTIRYYDGAITGDDEQIGRLLEALKQNRLMDNTLILFIADHGNCLGKHDEPEKNNLYEESLRVPFILYWKGYIIPRIDSLCMMSYPDIYPTILDMMGFKNKIPKEVQGISNKSYLLTGTGKHPEVQYLMGNILPFDSSGGFRGVRTKDFKLAYKVNKNQQIEKFLFNMKTDPFEIHNLYGQLPQITDSFKRELMLWLQQKQDPFEKRLMN